MVRKFVSGVAVTFELSRFRLNLFFNKTVVMLGNDLEIRDY